MLTHEQMMFLYRDMMTALEVGKKAEMGYYDVEIDTFGCAYYSQGERKYCVSNLAEKLYDFHESAAMENLYPTIVQYDAFKKPIPKGLKELLELDLKRDLAKKMRAYYSCDFLQDLQKLGTEMRASSAGDILNEYMDGLECTFNREHFDLFESTLTLCVSQKKLALKDYKILSDRLSEERKNISSELRPHDIFNQTFYVFCYVLNGEKKFFYDARKAFVYQKRNEFEKNGALVSPLFKKTCFYNYRYRLLDAKKDFVRNLNTIFTEEYFILLQNIQSAPSAVSKKAYEEIQRDFVIKYGEPVRDTLDYYGHRWMIM